MYTHIYVRVYFHVHMNMLALAPQAQAYSCVHESTPSLVHTLTHQHPCVDGCTRTVNTQSPRGGKVSYENVNVKFANMAALLC